MESGPEHPIGRRVRGYVCVGMEALKEPDAEQVTLRLTFRHPKTGSVRRLEFSLPVDQGLGIATAFSFLFKGISLIDHSAQQWEGRAIEIQFGGMQFGNIEFADNDYPGPFYADSVREVTARVGARRRSGGGKGASSMSQASSSRARGRRRRPG